MLEHMIEKNTRAKTLLKLNEIVVSVTYIKIGGPKLAKTMFYLPNVTLDTDSCLAQ